MSPQAADDLGGKGPITKTARRCRMLRSLRFQRLTFADWEI